MQRQDRRSHSLPLLLLPVANLVRQFSAVREFDERQPNFVFGVFRVTPANGVKRHPANLAGPGTSPSQSLLGRHLTQTLQLNRKGLVGSVGNVSGCRHLCSTNLEFESVPQGLRVMRTC